MAQQIDDLILQYLDGLLKPEQTKSLQQWIDADDSHKTYFHQQEELWHLSMVVGNQESFDKELAYKYFHSRVKATQLKKKKLETTWIRWSVAASIVILVSFVNYFVYTNLYSTRWDSNNQIMVETPNGSRTRIALPDGSVAWLNAGSKLSYSPNYGKQERDITLHGEGYFEVQKHQRKRFRVFTNKLSVEVLGTKFNIRNYQDEDEVKVTLIEGSVKLDNTAINKECLMKPNQLYTYEKGNASARLSNVNAVLASQWKDGILFFDEEKLPDIVRELERTYNVKITITDESIKKYCFFGNFIRTEQSIADVLEILATTNKFHYTIHDNKIVITP